MLSTPTRSHCLRLLHTVCSFPRGRCGVASLDIKAGVTHALLVCLNQLGAVLLSVLHNAAKGKGGKFQLLRHLLFMFLSLSLSHLPCITCTLGLGTGAACLALGFVTGAGCIRSCCCCCRRCNCLNDGDSFRCCAPHYYCCSRTFVV